MKRIYTTMDAARVSDFSQSSVRRFVSTGALPAFDLMNGISSFWSEQNFGEVLRILADRKKWIRTESNDE